jgi:DNA-binding SARP family transcriptional activator
VWDRGEEDGPSAPPFRVLGPFEVSAGERRLDVGGPRLRTLLALLIANAGRVTRVSTMVDALWGTDEPPEAAQTARTYVSRLRRSLAPAGQLIVTHSTGYVLRLAAEALDAARFERLVAAGREALAASRPAAATAELAAALELWRGDAYSEFADVPLLRAEAVRLDAMRLAATADRIDAELATGAGVALVDELMALTVRHPGDERLWGQLMIALYRAGRHAEAVAAFSRARAVLVGRFGLDPSPQLTEIHRQLLHNDAGLLAAPVTVTAARNDLPCDLGDFTGRMAELARLTDAAPAVAVRAIDGMTGVGKTALAVRAAHRLAARYPDAQLFIDLHGHTPGRSPTSSMTALGRLLRALDVPNSRIPADPDARAALWRAEAAMRSMLVVLDNAADVAQVRPLMPGAGHSLTLITSRRRLVGLDVDDCVSLDVLTTSDAVSLFGGDDREAARDVVEQCGHLPLAIRLAAARLRSRPSWTVRQLADRLKRDGWPLAEFEAADRGVAAAMSCHHLDPLAQRMFRLLGCYPGPDFDAPAAAALADVEVTEAERLLEKLVDDHLLREDAAGRYRFHPLTRRHAHAAALAEEADPDAALRRLMDFHRDYRLPDQQPPISVHTNHSRVPTVAWPTNRSA